jgi:hypothetical protein
MRTTVLLLLSHTDVEAQARCDVEAKAWGGAVLLLLSHDGGKLTDAELGVAEGGSSAPSLELHVEEAAVAAAQSPCGYRTRSRQSSRCDCRARSHHSPSLLTKTSGDGRL